MSCLKVICWALIFIFNLRFHCIFLFISDNIFRASRSGGGGGKFSPVVRYFSKISFQFSTTTSLDNFSFTSLATFSATEEPKESNSLNDSSIDSSKLSLSTAGSLPPNRLNASSSLSRWDCNSLSAERELIGFF